MKGSPAQAGFYYQNNVAALKIIECLFFDTDISHIQLENYEKGHHIDDVIIHRKTKIEYYQVKWANNENTVYSLYNLLASEGNKKSLFKQLAEGFKSIRNTDKEYTIILFTTKQESSQKRPSAGINHSLLEIRTNIFAPLKTSTTQYQSLPNYESYKDTLEKIRQECDLDKEDFTAFIKSLEFKFSQENIGQIQSAIKFKLNRLGIEENLFERLLDGVVQWSISGQSITKDTVLGHLKINDRFEDKLSHYFKVVDDKYYIENKTFTEKLNTALNELNGGYIFIEGLPGIGKSTALTKFKKNYPETILTYYCYIPDAKNDFGELRHKSHSFLKSLCIAIESNFPEVDLPNKYSNKYDEKLAVYLEKLGKLNSKIIFIIDGLDHVYRDIEFKESSLLNQIKGNLPNNVFFILSSQYQKALSSFVVNEIGQDARRHIILTKFSQNEIAQYLDQKGFSANDFLDKIEMISGGIPLYLHYISEILTANEKRNYDAVLDNLPVLEEGHISTYHHYLYKTIQENGFARWVLAILAYRQEHSSTDTISQVLQLAGINKNQIDVQNILNQFNHLLKQKDGRAFSIFHNSFREFILSKTPELKEPFNKALVKFYEQAPYTDEAYRNYFRHLNEIGACQKIIDSTTLNWIKKAWSNFRTIEEIENNIDIALEACVENLSLSDFIRISFLKAQIGISKFYLEDTDFPLLFLNAGLVKESLRSIWDGDFVIPKKVYFANYLSKYFEKTGNLLPQNIIEKGFSKPLFKAKSNDFELVFKGKSLVEEDIEDLFNHIDMFAWEDNNEFERSYLKNSYTDKKNAKINFQIKRKVVNHLVQHKQYGRLRKLSNAFKDEADLYNYIQLALFKLLLPTEKKSAIQILKAYPLTKLSDKNYIKLIGFCADYLTDQEIIGLFKKRKLKLPKIFSEVIERENVNYKIRKEILNLFEYLKPFWIFQTKSLQQLFVKISALPSPAKNLYYSIFHLSELWYKNRNGKISQPEKISLFKKALNELFSRKKEGFRKTNYGLFDSPTNISFISDSIFELFENIFKCAIEILSVNELEELINYWFQLENEGNGYKNHSIAKGIAKSLNANGFENFGLIQKLIAHSERLARNSDETGTLLSSLVEVAETYGICNFPDEFNRIYNELIEISFGLNYKKDYQASNILTPLRKIHEIEPENTLERLSEIFKIQLQLSKAGRSRMLHICLSELIAFTAAHYPELAFKLLEKEENNINRSGAFEIVLSPLIKKSSKDDLILFFSLIRTLPHWGRGNSFLTLADDLLERALQLGEENSIIAIIKEVRYNALVELEQPKLLDKFSEKLLNFGKEPSDYGLNRPTEKEEIESNPKTHSDQTAKFAVPYEPPPLEKVISLIEGDYSNFEEFIEDNFKICLQNRRNHWLRTKYHRSKQIFEKFYKTLTKQAPSQNISFKKAIRFYVEFKNGVVTDSSKFFNIRHLETYFDTFIEKVNVLFSDNAFKNFIEKDFDKDKWLEDLFIQINERRSFLLAQIISEEGISQLVNEVSILQVDNLIRFIQDWTDHWTKAPSLLKVAKRLVPINPSRAKKMLQELSVNKDSNFLAPDWYSSSKLDFDIVETVFQIDREFGKQFLLKSYLAQNGKYSSSITGAIDKLIPYAPYFDESNLMQVYFNANLQYNRELAKGLSDKNVNYDFIATHQERLSFEEIIIKHLVSVLNYPVIKVREATLKAIFDLVYENSDYLKTFMKFGLEDGNDNQIEYSLIILQAISIQMPSILLPFKKELWQIIAQKHFNIIETIKAIFLNLNRCKEDFLNDDELKTIKNLNSKSPLILNRVIPPSKRGKHFLFSEFQVKILHQLSVNEEDTTEFVNDLYQDLVKKGFENYSHIEEGNIHQEYNINTNFDKIEIQSPHYDEVKSSLNRIYFDKIKRGCCNKKFIRESKFLFRLHDPSNLFYRKITKPSYINWLPEISENDFLNFKDFEKLKNDFVDREDDFITLYEYGSQRPKDDYAQNEFTCYFEVRAFLKHEFMDSSNISLPPFVRQENLYSTELPSFKVSSKSFPIKGVKPILEISYNHFRGESNLTQAFLLQDFFEELGIQKVNLLDILKGIDSYPIEAFYWQKAYTSSSGRRRYKPTSEGFTLKIKKGFFLDFLSKNNLILCYEIILNRSATKYRPENIMEWCEHNEVFEVKF